MALHTYITYGETETEWGVLENTLSISDQIGARLSGSVGIKRLDSTGIPIVGQPVRIADDDLGNLFGGIIDDVQAVLLSNRLSTVTLTLLGWDALCDRHCLEAEKVFTNQKAGDCIKWLFANTSISGEGVAVGLKITLPGGSVINCVEDGPLISITLQPQSITSCISAILGQCSGYYCKIDADKVLQFHKYATIPAPFNFAIGDDHLQANPTLTHTSEKYANRFVGVIKNLLGSTVTESLQGDGSKQSFDVSQPIGAKPTIELCNRVDYGTQNISYNPPGLVTVIPLGQAIATGTPTVTIGGSPVGFTFNIGDDFITLDEPTSNTVLVEWEYHTGVYYPVFPGIPKTVGAAGETGFDWYWTLTSTAIAQDAGGTPLSADQMISVAYQPTAPATVTRQNDAEIAARAAIEGGTGIHTQFWTWDDPISAADAGAMAQAYVDTYSQVPATLDGVTEEIGLQSGMGATFTYGYVTLADGSKPLNATEFVIQSVNLADDNGTLRWTFKAVNGALVPYGIAALSDMMGGGSPFSGGAMPSSGGAAAASTDIIGASILNVSTYRSTDGVALWDMTFGYEQKRETLGKWANYTVQWYSTATGTATHAEQHIGSNSVVGSHLISVKGWGVLENTKFRIRLYSDGPHPSGYIQSTIPDPYWVLCAAWLNPGSHTVLADGSIVDVAADGTYADVTPADPAGALKPTVGSVSIWKPDETVIAGDVRAYNNALYHCILGYTPTPTWAALSRAAWTAYASGAEEAPALALDGDIGTKWNYEGWSLPQAIWVDMGAMQTVSRVRYLGFHSTFNEFYPLTVDLHYSQNGSDWTFLASGEAPEWGIAAPDENVQVFSPISCRYFRVTLKTVVSNTGTRVVCAELNLDNSDIPTPDEDTTHWELLVQGGGGSTIAATSVVLKGDSAGNAVAAGASDVAALFSGTGDYLKSDGSKGTPSGSVTLSDATPQADSGSGSAGTSSEVSRADHVHPASTSGGGGALVLLASLTASNSVSLDFTTRNASGQSGAIFQADFDEYLIECVGMVPASNAVAFILRMSTDGGANYDAGNNYGAASAMAQPGYQSSLGSSDGAANSGKSSIVLAHNVSNASGYSLTSSIRLDLPLSTSLNKNVLVNSFGRAGDGNLVRWSGGGTYLSTTAVTAVQVKFGTCNASSGTARVYGVAK